MRVEVCLPTESDKSTDLQLLESSLSVADILRAYDIISHMMYCVGLLLWYRT